MAAKDATTLEVPGPDGAREVRISSPGRELWPGTGITKLELAEYLVTVGPWFMPHRGPPPDHPAAVPRRGSTARSSSRRTRRAASPSTPRPSLLTYPSGRKHPQLVLNELAVAVWAVQMNTITLHPWPVSVTGKKGDTDNPDELRIDLDPQPGRDFHDAAVAALALKEVLADLDLTAYAKTSGNRGVHVHARIEPTHEFLDVRHGVIAIARELERRLPDLVTTSWWKEERGEKVFVDFNQANRDRTIASAFSPRPLKGAPVSMPVAWDDLTDVSPSDFTVRTVPPAGREGPGPVGVDARLGRHHRRSARLVGAGRGDGLPELNFPPDYPKMPGEPPRVQPSKKRYEDSEYLPDEGGYMRDNPEEPPGGWDSPRRRRR